MSQRKAVQSLSAAELYALAEEKEQEEFEQEKAAARAQIEELRAQRRALVAKHKKDLSAIDAKIRKLGGRSGRGGGRRSGSNTTAAVLTIVQSAKKISTKEIKAELEKQGIEATNLSQTLAYLKRQGKLKSPARSVYAAK